MKGSFLPTHSLPLAISFATFRMPKSNEWENKIKSSKNAHGASSKTMHTLTNCYIYQSFASKIEHNDFPSDGLVVIYDDIAYGESLGRTAKFPRNAMAFKWADEIRETTLKEIE
ncbi:MAG: hypothetical protein U0K35_09675, partial [Prevotella sp.]|nr:hypothetical protein [Prevotella sp.]